MMTIRARVSEFAVPPVHDALVLGRESPIGCMAVRHALQLLSSQPFAHFEVDDPEVSDILIREPLMRRITRQQLIEFVLERVRPLMSAHEILHLDLSIEIDVTQGPGV